MSHKISISGVLRVYRTVNQFPVGSPIVVSNMVVDDGLSAISRLIGGGYGVPSVGAGMTTYPLGDLAGAAVGRMLLGTRAALPPVTGADGDLGPIPNINVPSNGALIGSFSTADSTLVVSYPTTTSVRFTATLPAGSWNAPSSAITEEMLLTAMGTVFARVILGTPVNTTAGTGLSFAHDIILNRA